MQVVNFPNAFLRHFKFSFNLVAFPCDESGLYELVVEFIWLSTYNIGDTCSFDIDRKIIFVET